VNGILVTCMLALALAIIVVRRRFVGIALLAAQALALGIIAIDLAGGRSEDFLVASLLLLSKAVVLPLLLYLLIRRTPEARPVAAAASPMVRLLGAGAVALCAVLLIPPLGIGDAHTEHTSVALVLVGITIVIARRPILFQLLGLIVAENGLSLLAVSVPGGLSYVVEFGALFDLALIVTVAAAFAQRIHSDLGTGDTELLRGLRD
jgi:hydrogenase-4 membrane subunit HyfE